MIHFFTEGKDRVKPNVEEGFNVIKRSTKDCIEHIQHLVLYSPKEICIDLETTGLDCHCDKILLMGIYVPEMEMNSTIIIDWRTIGEEAKEKIKELITSDVVLIGHNIKFDVKFLKTYYGSDLIIKEVIDTMITHQVIYCGLGINKSLNSCLSLYLGIHNIDKSIRSEFENFRGKFENKHILYLVNDIINLKKLWEEQKKLIEQYDLKNVVKLENNAVLVYADIEWNGIYLDKDYWKKEIIDKYLFLINKTIDQLNNIIRDIYLNKDNKDYIVTNYNIHSDAGSLNKLKKYLYNIQYDLFNTEVKTTTINWESSKQLLDILKNILNRDVSIVDTKTGEIKDSTSFEVLERLKDSCKVCNLLLKYRLYSTILKNFGEKNISLINNKTNRIHPEFNQLGADTGRVSCKYPNLQNQPRGEEFRSGFKAQDEDGWVITADYSQMELRILAEASEDDIMITSFNNDEDIHSKMASIMNGGIEVTKSINGHLRTAQKTINFGLAYGAGAERFKHIFDGDINVAKRELDKFSKLFPNVFNYLKDLGEYAVNAGYSKTLPPFNRIRWYENAINAKETGDKSALVDITAKGKNQPIQGTSADVTKLASCFIREWINESSLQDHVKIINQVHDEIVIEVSGEYSEYVNEFADRIKELMELAGSKVVKHVKLIADYEIAKQWSK